MPALAPVTIINLSFSCGISSKLYASESYFANHPRICHDTTVEIIKIITRDAAQK